MNRLDVHELLAAARERTGFADFGPDDFMEGLQVLVPALNDEAHIRPGGMPQVRERLVRMLMNRAWFAEDLKRHPEIREHDIGSPVIMATLPRTGSTKLHRMLGAAGGVQTPNFWMTLMFARIPGEADGGVARRIRETREFEQWMYATSPAMLTGHPMFTDEPEEDLWLLESSFRHPIHTGVFDVPSYAQWLGGTDWSPAFDYLRAQTQYLRWQFPSARPWLAKTPSHLGFEAQLARVYDKPRFIVTHRDPVKCIPSITSTSMATRGMYSDYDSTSMLGPFLLAAFSAGMNQHLQWRDANPDVPVLDISFREVTENGVGAVRKVHDFLDLPFTAETEARVRAWERANPAEKHGKASYSAASIGSTDAEIASAFADYRARFADLI